MISSKILFIGTVEFSYYALKKILENKFEICGVITKEKSKFNSDFKDLTPLCYKHDIPFYFDKKDASTTKEEFINSVKPDVIYCFGWSYLLPERILSIPKHGVVGFHPAKLPYNRGRHPIIWALILGLNQTGSSFFIMDEGADTGDIISQELIDIKFEDDAASLYEKIKIIALEQIVEFTKSLHNKGSFTIIATQNADDGNSWRKRKIEDGLIDFRMSSMALYNLIRGLTKPYPGAHLIHNGLEIKVWKSSISDENYEQNIEPGKVLDLKGSEVVVKTYDGAIILESHEFTVLPKKDTYLI